MKIPLDNAAENRPVIIIGAGWSGLSAAVTLCAAGHPVTVLEAADFPGGRARTVPWKGLSLDNGQHLMIGAYQQMLTLMDQIGVPLDRCFQRQPLDLNMLDPDYPPLQLSTRGRLPWRLNLAWHLFKSGGWQSLTALFRLQKDLSAQRQRTDNTVAEWLLQTRQPERLIRQLWSPLCLATLNTPIEQASAAVFAQVLFEGLLQHQAASDLLLPTQPLGKLFPEPAVDFIQQHGGQVFYQQRVEEILIQEQHVIGVRTRKGKHIHAQHVIIALPASAAKFLLNPWINLPDILHYPICTVYLRYAQAIPDQPKITGLSHSLGQWLFDRSDLAPGLFAVVISGPGPHENFSGHTLIEQVARELHHTLPDWPDIDGLADAEVIREKRATFACTLEAQQTRPTPVTPINGLILASDWVKNSYPATLEGAILNGQASARVISNRITP